MATYTPTAALAPIKPPTIGATSFDSPATGYGSTDAIAAQRSGVSLVNQDPRYGTVEGRIGGLINADAPLMQIAKTTGEQEAARRGLGSSTMAVGAAQDALYRAATPIAGADAASYNQFALSNQGAENVASSENATMQQQAGILNAQARTAASQFGAASQNTAALQNARQSTDVSLQNMAAANQAERDKFAAEQQTALANAQAATRASEFGAQYTNEMQRLAAEQGFDITRMDKQAAITLGQMSAQQQNEVAKMALAQGYNLQSMSAQQVNTLAAIDAKFNTDAKLAALDEKTKLAVQAAMYVGETAMQTLKGDQAKLLADTEATYRNQIQSSDSAAKFYTAIVGAMTTSQTATGTTDAQKSAAATYYNTALRNGLAVISGAGGGSSTDLTSLLNFG